MKRDLLLFITAPTFPIVFAVFMFVLHISNNLLLAILSSLLAFKFTALLLEVLKRYNKSIFKALNVFCELFIADVVAYYFIDNANILLQHSLIDTVAKHAVSLVV